MKTPDLKSIDEELDTSEAAYLVEKLAGRLEPLIQTLVEVDQNGTEVSYDEIYTSRQQGVEKQIYLVNGPWRYLKDQMKDLGLPFIKPKAKDLRDETYEEWANRLKEQK